MKSENSKSSLITRILKIIPQKPLRFPFIILCGILLGLVLVIFRISNAFSYLSDSPQACMNCHVMTTQYATWQHSSHTQSAICNDCHVPHDNIFRKYYFKANDGLRHSFMFTFNLDPQVIRIHDVGKEVVQENCIRCHSNLVESVSIGSISLNKSKHGEVKLCWDCHREVPHGRVSSQASTPFAIVPSLEPVLPNWIISNK
jgi:cytochrome c nitrite reductase small subunit